MLYSAALGTVRRNNRYLQIISGVILGVALVIGLLSFRYYYNLLLGPFQLERDELFGLTSGFDDPLRDWIRVEGDQAIDTEYEFRAGEGRTERVTASYIALLVNDRQLLAQLPGDLINAPRNRYDGFLVPIPGIVQRGVVDEFIQRSDNPTQPFLPIMLDVRPLGGWGYAGFALNLAVLLTGAFGVALTQYRTLYPERHPMLRHLARSGELQTTLDIIEAEMNEPHIEINTLHLTRNWLVSQSPTSLEATRYEDIVWVYKKMTHQDGYSVLIHDRHGKVIGIRAKELKANEILNLIRQRAPWALTEYHRDTESAWRSHRQELVARVDERKPA